eukprot:3939088-Rhodomonas_salina.2
MPTTGLGRARWLQHIAALDATGPCGTETKQWVSEEALLEALAVHFVIDAGLPPLMRGAPQVAEPMLTPIIIILAAGAGFTLELQRRVARAPTVHGQAPRTVSFSAFMVPPRPLPPLAASSPPSCGAPTCPTAHALAPSARCRAAS